MANFLTNFYQNIVGGWKTVGAPGIGAFNMRPGDQFGGNVSEVDALKLSAFFACVRLLSETAGTLSFNLLDADNRVVKDHELYGMMRFNTNSRHTGDSFVTAMAANKAIYGNAMAHIRRWGNGKAYALDFYATDLWDVTLNEQGQPIFKLNGEEVPEQDVLHWMNFSTGGYWGIAPLMAGSEVMLTQISSNRSAAATFKSGLRAGGFFTMPENRQAFNDPQMDEFKKLLAEYSKPENTSKWLPLLPGMNAVANASYRIDPVTAELLQSRYFGVEEICRFMGVPPPLIGHTDKASSWASSVENLNQFLVTYTMLPQMTRLENQIGRKLLGPIERNRYRPNYNMDTLLRADIEKRFKTYEIGIQNSVYCPNDVLAKEHMPPREGGDQYVPLGAKTKEKKTNE